MLYLKRGYYSYLLGGASLMLEDFLPVSGKLRGNHLPISLGKLGTDKPNPAPMMNVNVSNVGKSQEAPLRRLPTPATT